MKAKFEKGQQVRVTKKNGKTVEGTITDWDYNVCTFEREYSIEYLKDGEAWRMICIPEDCIVALDKSTK